MRLIDVTAVVIAVACPGGAQSACLSCSGRQQIEGVLLRRTYPGPPNYESVAQGDRPETIWVVKLERSHCVEGAALGASALSAPIKSLREMQLVLDPGQYAAERSRIGKRVIVSGRLLGALTGHHHTPVLLGEVRFER